ncbi:MAG: hypothetical protein ACT4P6_13230 [Gemmatimonadaceae bacterium]
MRIDRHLFRLLGVALALTVAACGKDLQPTAANSDQSELTTQQLDSALSAEQTRVADAALASAGVYDSLMMSYSANLVGDLLGGVTGVVKGLLLTCRPLPYASDVETIGPLGGVLRVGPHTLYFPPGALSKATVITAEAPVSKYAQVTFKPHGMQFTNNMKPVLTLSYAHCNGLLTAIKPKIVYVDQNLNILEWLLSINLGWNKTVSAPLNHFSSYMVAY